MKLSKQKARRIALNVQHLDGRRKLPQGKEGAAQTIERLGYIQIDTIAVIERAHHHTLWTRRFDYHPQMLDDLLAKDRRIFEYWGHAASCLPMTDYRYYRPRMRRFKNPTHLWVRDQLEKNRHLMKPILERIRDEGPLSSKDFAKPPGMKTGAWWGWKPAKFVLEALFWQGELMVTERRNFERVYDLTERVLPPSVDPREPDDDELGRFLVRRALTAYGVARERDICEHIPAAELEVIRKSLRGMISNTEVVQVSIEGDSRDEYYALPGVIEAASKLRKPRPRVHLLSPFDNAIILRQRTKKLFDFEYSLECYLPAAKRKYGYFTLPILWGEDLIGRLDPKADRRNKTLIINNIDFEPSFSVSVTLLSALAKKLVAFAGFNSCEQVKLVRTSPNKVKSALTRHLKQLA